MKTTFTLAAALLLSGTAVAQNTQPDSMRVHIIENKNGQMLVIDTVFPASGHAQFAAWLQAQGIELPPPPPPGGNPVFFEEEIVEGEPGARHAHPPHPPLPPVGHGDSLHHVMMVREMHEGDSTVVLVRTHEGKQGEPLLRGPAGHHTVIRHGDSAQCRQMHEVMIIEGDTTNGKKVQKVIIVHPAPPVPPVPPVAPNGKIPPVPPVPPVPAEQKKQDGQKQVARVAPAGELMTVFPNPSTGNITLSFELPGKGKTNIRITDLNGKTVYEEQLGEAYTGRYTKDIDLSKYGKGIYLVEVQKADNVLVKKVVIE